MYFPLGCLPFISCLRIWPSNLGGNKDNAFKLTTTVNRRYGRDGRCVWDGDDASGKVEEETVADDDRNGFVVVADVKSLYWVRLPSHAGNFFFSGNTILSDFGLCLIFNPSIQNMFQKFRLSL